MSPILGIWASQNYSRYSLPTSFESIATTTVGSGGSSSITFSSIPSTYTHLQIRCIARDDRTGAADSDNIGIRFNSDTGSNYSWHQLYGTGSSVGAGGSANQTYCFAAFFTTVTGSNANVFAAGIIDILDYADTNKYKTTRHLGGFDNNGNGASAMSSGSWRNTSAVTSITLIPTNASNFTQNSQFALYGIKGA